MEANRQAFNAFIEEREAYFANFITKLNNLNTELKEILNEEEIYEDDLENIDSKRLEITISWEKSIEEEEKLNKYFEIFQDEDVYNISENISKIIEEKLKEIRER